MKPAKPVESGGGPHQTSMHGYALTPGLTGLQVN